MIHLEKKVFIQGTIHVLSGLAIGSSGSAMSIGGPDRVVIRNPLTNQPYIPGSSLKGKMRSLMEILHGNIKAVNMGQVKNGPHDNIRKLSTLLFGSAPSNDKENQRPSRIIVRDGVLLNPDELFELELPYTEAKTEVVIDRITSAAMPRTFERVPAGAKFELNLVLNIFDKDREVHPEAEKDLKQAVFQALQLVQDDYLGGGGSRGNGQIRFEIERYYERPLNFYQTDEGEISLDLPESWNNVDTHA